MNRIALTNKRFPKKPKGNLFIIQTEHMGTDTCSEFTTQLRVPICVILKLNWLIESQELVK